MTKDTGEEDRQPKSTLAKESSTKNEGAIFNYEASSSPSLLLYVLSLSPFLFACAHRDPALMRNATFLASAILRLS